MGKRAGKKTESTSKPLHCALIELEDCESFVARRDASLLYVNVAAVSIPPAAGKKTKWGVIVPCLISLTHWAYFLLLSFMLWVAGPRLGTRVR